MSAIKVSWEESKIFTILVLFQYLVAIYLFIVAIVFPLSIELEIAIVGIGVAFITIASSGLRNVENNQKIDQILTVLGELEDLQKEMQKEQKERQDSSPQIVPTLQAISQYYMDYINKQKGEDKK